MGPDGTSHVVTRVDETVVTTEGEPMDSRVTAVCNLGFCRFQCPRRVNLDDLTRAAGRVGCTKNGERLGIRRNDVIDIFTYKESALANH